MFHTQEAEAAHNGRGPQRPREGADMHRLFYAHASRIYNLDSSYLTVVASLFVLLIIVIFQEQEMAKSLCALIDALDTPPGTPCLLASHRAGLARPEIRPCA